MDTEAVVPPATRPTAERILDAAEDIFAQKGYAATSLGDVADAVGIRSPSLYNHFKNKEALYLAVLERLLDDFSKPLESLRGESITRETLLEWLDTLVGLHHARPNLARLLQHAALSGGPHTNELIERLFKPMFENPTGTGLVEDSGIGKLGDMGLQPWAVMALNNMVMSYVTMAPMYRDLLGQDPFGEQALENQRTLIITLLTAVLDYAGD